LLNALDLQVSPMDMHGALPCVFLIPPEFDVLVLGGFVTVPGYQKKTSIHVEEKLNQKHEYSDLKKIKTKKKTLN
jgi:hypothetical protein